jgi:hypothetical protein
MAKTKKTTDEEQLDLIDVAPENARAFKRVARKYKAAQTERLAWLKKEKEHKDKILELTKEAKLKPNANGVIRFRLDGIQITITPRNELVNVKDADDEVEESEE